MIIGIDATRANRQHKTGTEWYSYYLIRWLAKLDSQNQYILYTDRPLTGGLVDLTTVQFDPGLEKNDDPCFDKGGYQIIKSPYNNFRAKILRWPSDFLWTQGRLSIEMLKRPVDVLFVPAHTLPWVHPKKSVVTIHDVGFQADKQLYEDEKIGPNGKWKRRFLDWLVCLATRGKYRARTLDYQIWSTEYALKRAKGIITVSEFSKQELLKFNSKLGDKIKVIYNGYNKYLYKRVTDELSVKKVLDSYGIEQPYFFYVGRIERKKNIPALIEAFAALKEGGECVPHKLLLAGNASYGYDETNYLIRLYGLEDEVIMPGWIEENDMPFIYSGAEAFVFPSNYEGFGIPLLQAMACGVPVACSNTASLPEVVADAALYFDPHQPSSIADAMLQIISDNEAIRIIVKKGYKRSEVFSWEKTARETLKYINGLAASV
jgi:glycosyltransferase involved in cell wall biosynthesis